MNGLKKIVRILLSAFGVILLLLFIFAVFSIAPVDRTPIQKYAVYDQMLTSLDTLEVVVATPRKGFAVGFAKVNLTPPFETSTAGYAKRKSRPFSSVMDSLYVRALVIDNGSQRVAIVSADLLIIPPTVSRLLEERLAGSGFTLDNIYLGATHSHNSIGNWGEGATRFIYGEYKDSVVQFITDRIIESIHVASQNTLSSAIYTAKIPVPQAVENRVIDGGVEDSLMRLIEIHRADSSKLLFMTYTAHATCLYSSDEGLSRDYPGKLVDTFEEQGFEFAMFMAGSVGSHRCSPPKLGAPCIEWMAENLWNGYHSAKKEFHEITDSTLSMVRAPLLLADPQVKLTPEWKARAWLFRLTFGEYPVWLTSLRLGDLVMLGTPCDYSGEFDASLDAYADSLGSDVMVTSFNGGYIGYVTPVTHYDVEHSETQLMNWYPPGNGEYITQCLRKLIAASSKRE
jgi:hypothetical protein